METAWKTAAVDPVMVVMRSGQEPSEMVIRALLCGHRTSAGQRGSFLTSNLSVRPTHRPQQLETATIPGHSLDLPSPPNQDPWLLPSSFLTCSRIRFTVSPFCRRESRGRLLV